MKKIDGGICAANGFKASGIYCGIKKINIDKMKSNVKNKNDICLYVSDTVCNVAAVYTKNKVKGAPILVTKSNLEKSGNKAIAVIANSKNANTCNSDGIEKAEKMCKLVANELDIPQEQVIVASTGVIGQPLPIEPIIKAVPISVISSTLVKSAMFGEDANWGRILCAIGYSNAEFDINKVDVDLKSNKGIISVCKNGTGVEFSEKNASDILSCDEICILINLNQGNESASAWGCDLTYDYVKINGDYRT